MPPQRFQGCLLNSVVYKLPEHASDGIAAFACWVRQRCSRLRLKLLLHGVIVLVVLTNIANVIPKTISNTIVSGVVDAKRRGPLDPKRLKLVHITKTGGSALEQWGKQHGLRWGVHCPILKGFYDMGLASVRNASAWHVPIRYFTFEPYRDFTMFTVVRNPYTRMISTFRCPWGGYGTSYSGYLNFDGRRSATVSHLNSYLKHKLVQRSTTFDVLFEPQFKYVFGTTGERLIAEDHVLRYENFNQEFAALAEKYGLPDEPVWHENKSEMRSFTIDDLSEDVRRLIETVFSGDFDAFGYRKLSPLAIVNSAEVSEEPASRDRPQSTNVNEFVPAEQGLDPPNSALKLKLVHITNTGGSMMEKWGKQHGFKWGKYCPILKDHYFTGKVAIKGLHYGSGKINSQGFATPWFVPQRYFMLKPYRDFTMFTVVRNPYTRMISAFRNPSAGYGTSITRNRAAQLRTTANVKELNLYLMEKLNGISTVHRAFFAPQYMYVFSESGERLIENENILRFEHLATDFDSFVKQHELPADAALPDEGESEMREFNVEDLTDEVQMLIEEIFAADFEAFGYTKKTRKITSLRIDDQRPHDTRQRAGQSTAKAFGGLLDKSKKLKLAQISETGGSVMEEWGLQHGLKWGKHCPILKHYYEEGLINFRGVFFPWQVPLRYFTTNPYKEFTPFAVIRDPYNRMISAFRCPRAGYGTPYSKIRNRHWRTNATAAELNWYLSVKLGGDSSLNDALFIPQYFSVFGEDGERFIAEENLLRFEHFDADVENFAQKYGLSVDSIGDVGSSETEMRVFDVNDLKETVRRLIENIFEKDFETFGYAKLA